MTTILTETEVRVLGALLEKSLTTPEYYPLSLTALTAACNQKSNRDPLVNFDEATVVRALNGLKEKQLVVQSDSSRVPKYAETFVTRHNLLGGEAAIMMVLLLRGAQTAGEIRTRSERAHPFASIESLESVLTEMIEAGLLIKLARQPGRKEPRYAHLLAGEPRVEDISPPARPEAASLLVQAENDRIEALTIEIKALRADLDQLRAEFHRFQQQFE